MDVDEQELFINSATAITLTHFNPDFCQKPLLVHKAPIPLGLVEAVCNYSGLVRPRHEVTRKTGVRTTQLRLRISECLAVGRCSIVFAVEIQGLDMDIPPMVIKVARRSYTRFIAREAWFYDELACLQGSVIPRCFGYFSAKLSEDIAPEWDEIRPNPDFDLDYPESTIKDLSRHTQMEYGISQLPLGKFNAELLGDLCESSHFSFLLLERLSSERLPGQPHSPERLELRKEIFDLFHSFSDLGIYQGDVTYGNILKAYPSPPGWPSLPCPVGRNIGKIFGWRVIDFELSQKNNSEQERADFWHGTKLYDEFNKPTKGIVKREY